MTQMSKEFFPSLLVHLIIKVALFEFCSDGFISYADVFKFVVASLKVTSDSRQKKENPSTSAPAVAAAATFFVDFFFEAIHCAAEAPNSVDAGFSQAAFDPKDRPLSFNMVKSYVEAHPEVNCIYLCPFPGSLNAKWL